MDLSIDRATQKRGGFFSALKRKKSAAGGDPLDRARNKLATHSNRTAAQFNREALDLTTRAGKESPFNPKDLGKLLDPNRPLKKDLKELGSLGAGARADVSLFQTKKGQKLAVKEFVLAMLGKEANEPLSVAHFRDFTNGLKLSDPRYSKVYHLIMKQAKGSNEPKVHLLMEFVDGRTTYGRDAAPKDPKLVEAVLSSVLHSLDQGIIPNDLCGANVMVTSDNQLKWIDYGEYRTGDAILEETPSYWITEMLRALKSFADEDQIELINAEAEKLSEGPANSVADALNQYKTFVLHLQKNLFN